MRFAIRVPAVGPAASVDRLIETTVEAESLGYDALMVTDHIHKSFEKHRSSPPACGWFKDPSNTEDPVLYEAVSTTAFLAGMTNRLELGIGVMPLLLRDAAVLAKQLATLDVLARGRVIFGVGVSNVTDKPEYAALGRPFLPYAERYAMLAEQVQAMRDIWEKPSASFHGRYVQFDDLTVFPKPARRIPIWIGCGSLSKGADHPAVRFTLDHADGWLFPFLADPAEIGVMIADFRKTAAEVGRDLSGFDYCVQRRISLGETEAEAHANVDWVVEAQTDMWRWAGYMHSQGQAGYTANLANVSLGTPDDMCRMVEAYAAAGATMIEIVPAFATYDQLLRQVRLFGSEVLPHFR
jgi:alkanesulfonate monooxygenase SsuD/methylene tetrahydromethanopterin reductase-like flavin-dependent oxidoreductase (luciferase family)